MARKYDSTRREEAAARTRQAIVEAAVKLHGQGITTMSAVADEARVSLPTVTKYFPTREDLFGACTSHVAARLPYPSVEALSALADPAERIPAVVHGLFQVYEAALGQNWTGYTLEQESPVMARVMAEQDAFSNQLADLVLRDWARDHGPDPALTGYVRGLLHGLTYRALRVKSGLDFETAVRMTTRALGCLLDVPVRVKDGR